MSGGAGRVRGEGGEGGGEVGGVWCMGVSGCVRSEGCGVCVAREVGEEGWVTGCASGE